jgi:hypothetical protein
LLGLWRSQLHAGARLVFSDVILSRVGTLSGGSVRLLPAPWSPIPGFGLTSYEEAEVRNLLSAPGLDATRHPHSLGVNRARMTIVYRCTEPKRTPPTETAHAGR